MFNLTMIDFLKRSGIVRRVFTQTIVAGIGQYVVPDDIMLIEECYVAGRWIGRETQATLNASLRNWRRKQDIPQYFYEDGLPLKTMGLAPVPNYDGAYIIGPNEPDPPHAVYDAFSAVCALPTGNTLLSAQAHRGLTIIGPRKPAAVAALTDPIPLIADDWALAFLGFGVLERIFSGDNELADKQRAAYCAAQYLEGVNLGQAISGEVEGS
jgi:hypothetical protein